VGCCYCPLNSFGEQEVLFPQHISHTVRREIACLLNENFLLLHRKSQVLEENHLLLKTADNFLTEGQNEVI